MTQKVLVNSFIQKLLMFINDKKCLGSISKHKKVCSVKWTKSVTEKNIITILNKRYTRCTLVWEFLQKKIRLLF